MSEVWASPRRGAPSALYRRLHGPALAVPATVCALGLVATWTLSDHSSTGIQTWLGIPVASVHLLAMALWLGGLTFLLEARARSRRGGAGGRTAR